MKKITAAIELAPRHRKIKTSLLLLLLGVFGVLNAPSTFAALPPGSTAPKGTTQEDLVDGLIIKYRDSLLTGTAASGLAVELGRVNAVGLKYKRAMSGNAHVLALDKPTPVSQAKEMAARIARDPRVLYAEPDYRMYAQLTPNDPLYTNQWHYYEPIGGLNLPRAWDISTGDGVVVAVIDSGFRPHVDLVNNIFPGYDFITDPTLANDGDGRDSDARDPGDVPADGSGGNAVWHGTHVAGTIAAQTKNGIGVAGVAFNARIVPIRVLGLGLVGFVSDIVDGMRWAAGLSVSGVPANQHPAQVLNLSLSGGGACAASFASAITDIRAQNATIVVAAGNSAADVSGFQPANCTGVIAVAATSRAGARASYSNFGSLVTVAAPGGDGGDGVLSTYNSGTIAPGLDNYAYLQGTSMAAPHVSGAVALMYSLAARLGQPMTPDQAAIILRSTARAFPGACAGCGAGIVDADAALVRMITVRLTPVLAPLFE